MLALELFYSETRACSCHPPRLAWPHRRRELASDGVRYADARSKQRRPPGSKRCETKVKLVCASVLIAAAVLNSPTRNGSNAQGVNLNIRILSVIIYLYAAYAASGAWRA